MLNMCYTLSSGCRLCLVDIIAVLVVINAFCRVFHQSIDHDHSFMVQWGFPMPNAVVHQPNLLMGYSGQRTYILTCFGYVVHDMIVYCLNPTLQKYGV